MEEIVRKLTNTIQVFWIFLKLKCSRKCPDTSYIQFKDFFTCETTAKLTGYTFLKNHKKSPNKWIRFNGTLLQVSLFFLVILEIISLGVSFQYKSFYAMIENMMFGGVFTVASVQIYTVFNRNQSTIHKIVEKLEEHFPHCGVDQITFDVQSYLKISKWHARGYYILSFIIAPEFTLMPFLHQIYGIMTSTSIEWELILILYLPFDQFQPIVFQLIYIIQLWMIIFIIIHIFCTDMLFGNLMLILSMEFEILGQIISEINPANNEEEAVKELKKLVDIHQQLIEVSEKMEEIFSPLQLFNAFGSIAALCTAVFLALVKLKIPQNSILK